jgi:hypothetical protein
MQRELERGDDAEVAPGAPHRPEELGVHRFACGAHLPVGRDDLDRAQTVERQPILAMQRAQTAVQGQAGDAGGAHLAARRGETPQLRLTVDVAPRRTALHARDAVLGIDVHAAHLGEVDDDPSVVDGVTGDVVRAAADRHEQAMFTSESDRVDHVGRSMALHDQRRAPVDQPVPYGASIVVRGIARLEDAAAHPCCELLDPFRVDRRRCFGAHLRLLRHSSGPVRSTVEPGRAPVVSAFPERDREGIDRGISHRRPSSSSPACGVQHPGALSLDVIGVSHTPIRDAIAQPAAACRQARRLPRSPPFPPVDLDRSGKVMQTSLRGGRECGAPETLMAYRKAAIPRHSPQPP